MTYEIGYLRDRQDSPDALEEILGWLTKADNGRFVLVLGDFGTGKTFLLRQIALRLGAFTDQRMVPLFVELRSLQKAPELDQLLGQHMAKHQMDFVRGRFHYMLEEGRIVLLFDGFDELALRVGYGRATDHLETILQAVKERALVVLTSRTQHFESARQVRTALGKKVEAADNQRIVRLRKFAEPQIREYLRRRMGDDAAADARFELLQGIPDLPGLSANPRLLSFIAELRDEDLEKARSGEEQFSAANLYQVVLDRWLSGEVERVEPKGAEEGLPLAVRWRAVTKLALMLWLRSEKTLSRDELGAETARCLESLEDVRLYPAEIATHEVGSGTLLVRDEDGAFAFVHQSVLEWLVAKEAADVLREEEKDEVLAQAELSALMVDFFCDLATRGGGDVGNHFWHTIGLVRFAPGELDEYLEKPLRVPEGEPLF
jgi:predicted kinase